MRHSILGFALLCVGAIAAQAAEVTLYDTALAEGVWFFSQGDAPEAAVQFRRALEQRPGDGYARYLLGLSLLASGEAEQAAKEIAASLEADPPPPVDRSRILADLQAAQHGEANPAISLPEVRKKPRRWSGFLSLSAERDSNPNLLADDLTLPVLPGGGLVSGRSADTAMTADLQARHRPVRLPAGWTFGLDLSAGGSFHQELDYLNLARAGGSLQFSRGLGPAWTLILRTGAEEIFLDGSDYLRTGNAGVSLVFSPTVSDTTRLDLRYQDRSFADHRLADARRSGGETGFTLRQTRAFGRRDRYVTLGITALDRQADPEFQRGLLGGSFEAALPISRGLALSLSGWLDQERFDDQASNLLDPQGPARDDRTRGASAALTVAITDRLQARLRGAYTRRTSNVGIGNLDFGYRRTVVGTSLSWSF
ncbi:MAG TPA: tetratricopeptide repeat protein [Thermoanaerobaculia bacterium]|jgi:hypothetical protein|nr:tetratricopeptide repeat protein [Thermoanaerobaculia bacterium]